MENKKFISSYKSFIISLIITLAFAIYNIYLGIAYQFKFSIAMAIYYVLLAFLRGIILLFEHHYYLKESDKISKKRNHFNTFNYIFLLIMDATLIVPISLLAMHQKMVAMTTIPAIAMAAYTTYKVTMAIINYKKGRNNDNISIRMLRIIAMVDMCISILSLQNTLIMVFGDSSDNQLLYLTSISSFAIMVFIFLFTIFSYRRVSKYKKNQ